MATTTSRSFTFAVPGEAAGNAARAAAPASGLPPNARAKACIRLGTSRAAAATVQAEAREGEDVVVLTIANGPRLVLSPERAADLFRSQGAPTRGAGADAAIAVPAQLGWPGLEPATRGIGSALFGGVTLLWFEIFGITPKDAATDLAVAAVTLALDGAVTEGLYRLRRGAALVKLKNSGDRVDLSGEAGGLQPLLVLLHGTFVDTASTFGKLWDQHSGEVRRLFDHYEDRVYAFDHPTMTKSPLGNALALVEALPMGARLHLLTHSRGGLVAEALARACAGKLTADEKARFAAEGYSQHARDLEKLFARVKAKGISVERMVRVACPSRGTLLASRRLDAYLSVLRWTLELAEVPVLPALVDFLHEVARRRADPAELPGLEALMPESPFVAWLNGRREPVPGELRVLAGDIESDSLVSWVKTLVADGFYWTDNDLVVHTRSMYGGLPRDAAASGPGARFVLARGGKVSHFSYFQNAETVQAIVAALIESRPDGYAPIGPLSWAGKDGSGVRAALRSAALSREERAARPAVIVLPGILGSNIKRKGGERIWLGKGFINGLKDLAWSEGTDAEFESDGALGKVYDKLEQHLASSHEVIEFAYDWRRPMEDEARRLAGIVEAALALREGTRQPVRILAHSMGGLVTRTMQITSGDTWRRMMARPGARFVMLGTPNGGSWAPMETMSGDSTFGNALVAFGALLDNGGGRAVMAGMPGFLQLQAGLLDPELKLNQRSTWEKLVDDDIEALLKHNSWHDPTAQRAIYQWSAPPQDVLDRAARLRHKLDAQLPTLASDADKIFLVVGEAEFTPAGVVMGPLGLEYVAAPEGGDGRVTLSNARLPGVKTWQVKASHGDLPSTESAFDGYADLLAGAEIVRLDRLEEAGRSRTGAATGGEPAARPTSARGRRPSRVPRGWTPPTSADDVLGGAGPSGAAGAPETALQVEVRNGDLQFISEPLLVGHYTALRLSGAESVVDRMVGGAMSRALGAGLYPDPPGSNQIFLNRHPNPRNVLDMPRPAAVVVLGLGQEGELRSNDLAFSVRQAVLAYAQRASEAPAESGAPVQFELAATLIGSGGSRITIGDAAQAIVRGVRQAAQRIAEVNQELRDGATAWPQIGKLSLVELYLDRATEAWRALREMEVAEPAALRLGKRVESDKSAKRRTLDGSYRGAAYDFISALSAPGDGGTRCISYRLDTRRARSEVTAQRAQSTLLTKLVKDASNDANTDRRIGRTLFNLLVPVEIETYLAGSSEMQIELDKGTAAIPWELLDVDAGAAGAEKEPWAIRTKLIRRLQTDAFRAEVRAAGPEAGVLVIGEPECDAALYPPLDGARREAEAVRDRAVAILGADRVRALVARANANAIIGALFEGPHRIVHIAGHGEPGPSGGVVLSGAKVFLGPNEIRAMRVMPELVFLNCCHLAARGFDSVARAYDRARFAANIADALIEGGVRCVIAAGWAVEDDAAEAFADAFYDALLGGERFIDAVRKGRQAAWRRNPRGNTWAAYQCYGDPDWRWSAGGADAQRPAATSSSLFSNIASPVALCLALESLASDVEYGRQAPGAALDEVRSLEAEYAGLWGAMGTVADSFGVAYGRAGDSPSAIRWYALAVNAEDGTASFRAAEQLANHRARAGDQAGSAAQVQQAIADLQALVALRSTRERQSLLGSAFKRLTMVHGREAEAAEERGDAAAAAVARDAAAAALDAAATHYANAEAAARAADAADLFYPAKSAMGCELRRCFTAIPRSAPSLDPLRLQRVRDSLARSEKDSRDFWSVVGQSEVMLLQAIAEKNLAGEQPGLLSSLAKLKARVPAPWMWKSVRDEGRFVLLPYARHAARAEAAAAMAILAELEKFSA